MDWLTSHWGMIATVALVLSETAALIVQVAFPQNKGVAGFIAGLIKFFQLIGGKQIPQDTQK